MNEDSHAPVLLPPLRLAPDPFLLKAVPLEGDLVSPGARRVAELLRQLLVAQDCISLSAPQIGEAHRLFVLSPLLVGEGGPQVFINPVILKASEGRHRRLETCKSVRVPVRVHRALSVRVQARDLDGQLFEVDLGDALGDMAPDINRRGLAARCAQHELDHLNGVLITARRS